MKLKGTIVKGIGGFYYVDAAGEIYECKARGVFRKEKIMPLVGDRVEISADENGKNTIDVILERRNFFKRPPVANVDNLIITSSTCDPKPNMLIIDRMTAVAFYKNVQPVVVFTKDDLYSADEYIQIYKTTGIPVFAVSSKTGEGVDEIRKLLQSSVSAFTGNSGVGKSTLINCICPEFSLETGEISKKLGRGRHTTRHVELLKFEDGFIVDTPGFSSVDFETNDIIRKEYLADCFPEFSEYKDGCKFTSCSHINDKGCKVAEAVENGLIAKSRHDSYVSLYNEVKDIKDWQL